MSKIKRSAYAEDLMAAVAHILAGRAVKPAVFDRTIELVMSGRRPSLFALMQLMDRVEKSGRAIVWLYEDPEAIGVPQIGLVANIEGSIMTFESCMLWMEEGADRARLMPDAFCMGSFWLKDDLSLVYEAEGTVETYEEAKPGLCHAVEKLAVLRNEKIARRLARTVKAA